MSVTLKIQRGIAWKESNFGTLVPANGLSSTKKASGGVTEEKITTDAMVFSMKIVSHVLEAANGNAAVFMYKEPNGFGIEATTLDTEEDIVLISISAGRVVGAAKKTARKVAPKKTAKKSPAKPPVKRATPEGATKAPARKAPAKKAPAKKAATTKAAATPAPRKAPAKKAAPAKATAARKAPAKAPVGRRTKPPVKKAPARK